MNRNLYSIINIYGFKLNSDKQKNVCQYQNWSDFVYFFFTEWYERENGPHGFYSTFSTGTSFTLLYFIMYLLFYFTIPCYFFGWHV